MADLAPARLSWPPVPASRSGRSSRAWSFSTQLDYVLEKVDGAWTVTDFNVQGVWVVDIYRIVD